MSSFKDWLNQWSQHLVNEQLKCSPTQKSPRWTVSAVGSRCSWLTAVSGRAFPSFLLLGSSCPARIAEEPNWSQVRPPGDLLHYNAPWDFGEGRGRDALSGAFKASFMELKLQHGAGLTKATSSSQGIGFLFAVFCVYQVWSSFEPASPWMSSWDYVTLEFRADVSWFRLR